MVILDQKQKESDEIFTPWMTQKEIACIKGYLSTDKVLFEWGSGGSTIEFSKKVKSYYSIEHDLEWYNKINSEIGKNVKLYLFPPQTKNLIWKKPTKEGKYNDFRNYIGAIDLVGNLEINFDLILIDGRARVECAKRALGHLKEDGFIFIHDFDRTYYWEVLDDYELIEVVDRLAVLKKRGKNSIKKTMDKAFLIKRFLIN